jgi:RNA polymerase sigma-70 factor (ECF subfamily)
MNAHETVAGRSTMFEEYRALLFAIAYRMLGTVGEAEDAIQETYLRFQSVPMEEIRSPKAFLSTVVTRICLDQLKSARVSRETYIGPWLPEPIVAGVTEGVPNPADVLEERESISMAFLVLLETLTPVERAVFLLREVFDYDYSEIARIVNRSEPACRQVFHRAKEHLLARRPRFDSDPSEQERLVRGFLRACEGGDVEGLTAILSEDVVLWSDGGGRRPAALNPIRGADRVVRLLFSIIRRESYRDAHRAHVVDINGAPGIVVTAHDAAVMVLGFETDNGRIHGMHLIVNPDKLVRLTLLGNVD